MLHSKGMCILNTFISPHLEAFYHYFVVTLGAVNLFDFQFFLTTNKFTYSIR